MPTRPEEEFWKTSKEQDQVRSIYTCTTNTFIGMAATEVNALHIVQHHNLAVVWLRVLRNEALGVVVKEAGKV